ncbi:AraC family transcriptional regulator [Paenibacillus psychroresistens]|nr:AraC family transcriptional regulator [Paenibacillus psychroresistens]
MKTKNEQLKSNGRTQINNLKRWTFDGIDYGVPEIVLFGFDDARKAIPLVEHHHVSSFEFVYIEKGKASWETEQGKFETRAGEVFYTLPDEIHRGSLNIIEPCRFWWIVLQIPTVHADKRWLGIEATEAAQLLEILYALPRVSKPQTPSLRSLQRIRAAIERSDPLVSVEVRISVLDFLLSLKLPKPLDYISAELISSMEKIKAEISTRLDWNPRLEELAAIAHVSPSYYHKVFQSYTGLTPKSYLDHVKIAEATRLLKETKLSVTEITFMLGYSSTQHFATAFRRLMGQTPTQLRLNS